MGKKKECIDAMRSFFMFEVRISGLQPLLP